ncbi:MAG: FAD/NAD(P)-binding protein [Myxococcota bacterium]
MGSDRLEALVVGAGIAGVCVALRLLEAGVPADALALVDPEGVPLARWWRLAGAVEMRSMRSPALHHLDRADESLLAFAHALGRPLGARTPPPLDLFAAHTAAVVGRAGLAARTLRAAATGLRPDGGGWTVATDRGPLWARRVVLALGGGERPDWPDWARTLRARGGSVAHVFEVGFRPRTEGRLAVVGGGLSGAQVVLAAVARGQPAVWSVRRPPVVSRLDADAGWFTGEALLGYHRLADPVARRRCLDRSRRRGSVPRAVAARLEAAVDAGRVRILAAPVRAVAHQGALRLWCGDERVDVDHLVLATGFARGAPGRSWLAPAAAALGLPRAPCGFPVPDPRLAWAPGLSVTGALAELELGAAARAIAGARRGAALIGGRV